MDALDVPAAEFPKELQRAEAAGLPELGELDVVRHFTLLSQRNFGIDSNFYPLGSCTMKYNPKIAEVAAAQPGFAALHPHTSTDPAYEDTCQGAYALIHELERQLAEIVGMKAASLQPIAGAHGELAGILMIKRALEDRGELARRRRVLVPDSAHGTNPATAAMRASPSRRFPALPTDRWITTCWSASSMTPWRH